MFLIELLAHRSIRKVEPAPSARSRSVALLCYLDDLRDKTRRQSAVFGRFTMLYPLFLIAAAAAQLATAKDHGHRHAHAHVERATTAYGNPPAASASGISKTNLTPNGKKAGLSGYIGIQNKQGFKDLAPYISWYSDYTATTPSTSDVQGIGMLWGGSGSTCPDTSERLTAYMDMVAADKIPDIMFGFYEPDCNCPDSSQMTCDQAASAWDSVIAPLTKNSTVLGSPSMCKQMDEDFLTPFKKAISTGWDVTSVHINKPDLESVKKVVEYFWTTYQKPIWVSEFACVHDQPSWEPCTDQGEIDQLIKDAVSYFEGNEHVVAYGPSNGNGLGNVWPLTDSNGDLSASGKTYLAAIKGL